MPITGLIICLCNITFSLREQSRLLSLSTVLQLDLPHISLSFQSRFYRDLQNLSYLGTALIRILVLLRTGVEEELTIIQGKILQLQES
ncbi:uncharacterized protein LOC110615075 isoform X2 [Manihot esculenta]|uniref:uncharacterized protein LOC110615075 isoform X2 n=1 Tax=Manihot esculenta TaxID=3983 RepID=UPI000B5D24D4|nr:uncharacterized protein LOC110615075 isoform X2 [Manihot esculenta]